MPKSTSVTLAVDEKTLPMATITGGTDRQTDRRTDRVRRNMRPPPREEGRIIIRAKTRLELSLEPTIYDTCLPLQIMRRNFGLHNNINVVSDGVDMS